MKKRVRPLRNSPAELYPDPTLLGEHMSAWRNSTNWLPVFLCRCATASPPLAALRRTMTTVAPFAALWGNFSPFPLDSHDEGGHTHPN